MQRPRDRRRRQRQDIDFQAELAQELLLRDAESLLLVDHDEPEALRQDVTRQRSMGADEDVDLPGRETCQGLLDLSRLAEPRHHLDLDREVREACAERAPVLLREDRGRREEQRLPAVERRGERSPDSHLRLPEAHVATDQPVHRPWRLEVLLHRLDRSQLVVRLSVGEGSLEALEPAVGQVVGEALGLAALRIEREQLACELAGGRSCAVLEQLPGAAAELGKRRALGRRLPT